MACARPRPRSHLHPPLAAPLRAACPLLPPPRSRYDLQKELTYTLITLGKLEAMNARASKQEDREGIDAVVKDAVRIFSRSSSGNDYPALPEPTGYSMDPIGKDHLSIFED